MQQSIAARDGARGSLSFSDAHARALHKPRASLSGIFGLAALALSALPLGATAAGSPDIVISQAYGGGGNTNATYKNDFIELFNRGSTPANLSGWSVQYAGATGTNWQVTNLTNVTLQPGQYYLIQEAAGSAGTANLPTPDATGTISMASAAFKIALASSTATLSGACPTTNVVDFLGAASSGTNSCFEGSGPAPAPSNTTADVRAANGCTDTDNNAADFTTAAPNPRNSATALSPCNASTNPGGTGAANPSLARPGDTVLLTIATTQGANPASPISSVTVDLTSIGGSATQTFYDNGSNGDATAGDGTWSYSTSIGAATALGSKILPATITDGVPRTGSATISLTVIPPPEPHTIMEIQGHGARSSFAGSGTALGTTYVITPSTGHQNIVTAVGPKGFFLQDTVGDGDPTTSDGIYVYTGSAPALLVGDLVSVTGRVQEFSGSTEIAGGSSYSVVGHDDNSIPAAYDLTATLPNPDPSSGICTGAGSTIQVPSLDGLTRNDGYQAANFACLDGMLVTMSHGIVNAPTYTTANSGITPSPTSPNNGFFAVAGGPRSLRKAGILGSDPNRTANIPTFWGNPELIQVYYPGLGVAAGSLPQAQNMPAGGIYDGGQEIKLTGVMQGFQSATMPDPTYELYPRSGADLVLLGAPNYPVAVPDPVAGKLRIGTQNMLHFFDASFDGADTSAYTDRCLASPADVAGNVSGLNTPLTPGADDTCPTSTQYQTRLTKMSLQIRTVLKAPVVQVVQEAENWEVMHDLAAQIHSDDASITYQPYLLKGNDPGGINIGIFVRSGVTVTSVTQLYLGTTTTACSSGGTCLLNDRPPVLLDATYQGYHFRVLAIYDRSLGSLGAAGKDYVGQKRRAQAEQVACIMQALQTTGAAVDCDANTPGAAAGNAQQDASGTVTAGSFPISGDATVPVIVLGDFNAYEFSDGYVDVTGTIMGTVDAVPTHSVYPPTASYVRPNPVLFDTGSMATQAQHYSYNFGGYLQEIDHILLTSIAQNDFIAVDSGRGNSDSSVVSLTLTQADTARRTSDHDGQVVTLGYVVTPSSDANSTISAATVQTVGRNAQPTFTITPAAGYTATVGGSCGSSGPSSGTGTFTYIVNAVTADCTVSVTSTSISYTVSSSAGSGGSIGATQVVAHGNTASFTVTPDPGYHTTSVTDNCGAGGTNSNPGYGGGTYVTGPIFHDCTVTASFYINSYLVKTSVPGGGGQISAPTTHSVDYNATTSFTAIPDSDHHLASASGDTCSADVSGNTITTGAITADCTITVVFALDVVNGACGSASGGTFTTLTSGDANLCSAGTVANFTGSGPWSWTCNGSNGGASANCSASINTWNVNTTGSGIGGTISAPAAATVNHGSATTFTVTANSGYSIASVTGDTCTPSVQSGSTWTTGPITANCTITASFAQLAGYIPLNPARILDTRSIGVTSDGLFAAGGAVSGGNSIDLTVLGRGGVPASGVKAVVLNVTATGTTAASYVTVWPTGSSVPGASNLNIVPGQNNTNLVIAKVGTNGKVSLFNALGATDLIADVQGYFSDTADLTPLTPARFLDTRAIGTTVDGLFENTGALAGMAKLDLDVAGRASLPASGVGAVILNVTATGTTAPGFVTVWPAGSPTPPTSNLNFVAGQTIPNLVITKIGNSGRVSLFNSAGNTDLIADVMGWFPTTSALTSIDPARLLDTRAGIGATTDGQFAGAGPISAGGELDLLVNGRGGVPASGVGAVVLNVTVTGPSAAGYLTAWPTGSARPLASNLNFVAGQTIPNLVIVKVGGAGKVSLFNSAGNSDVIVDVVGWLAPPQ